MSAEPVTDELLFTKDAAGIARIVLNRPQARNALTFAMYEGLITLAREIEADAGIKAVIVTGAGEKAFAAGTDIAQFRSFTTPEDALGYERFMDRVLGSLERLRVPTIAAIAGACTGGRRGDRGGLRPADRHARRPLRLPDRPDAGQLPVPGQPEAALGPDRPRPRQGHPVHRPPRRRRGGLAIGLASEVVADPPPSRPAPPSSRRCSPATRRSPSRPPRRACAACRRATGRGR